MAEAAGSLAAAEPAGCVGLSAEWHRKAWGLESRREGSRPFSLRGLLDLSGVNYICWALTELAAWAHAPRVKNNFLQREAVVSRSCLIPQAPAWAPGAAAMRLLSPPEP